MDIARTICRAPVRRRGSVMRVTFGVAVFTSILMYMCLLRNQAQHGEDSNLSAPTFVRNSLLKGFYLQSDQWRLSETGHRLKSEGVRHLMADRRKLEFFRDDGEELINSINSINCNNMEEIEDREFLAAGWTKAVYSGRYHEHSLAVKVVNTNGHDVQTCLREKGDNFQDCYRKSAAKILKEIVLFKELVHNNMLKVFGYCIPNGDFTGKDGGVVAMVTELGEPLDIIKLLQMSWEDRLRICLGVARLLYYLAHSPLGSLAMNDFRRQQFVLVNGELKLSDVDDVSVEEPLCPSRKNQCDISLLNGNLTLSVKCVQGVCRGHNEKVNIIKAGRHFTTFLLPHGAPTQLRPLVDEIVRAYNTVSWDSKKILAATEDLVQMYVSGKYLKNDRKLNSKFQKYRKFEFSDLPGYFDYRCQLSLSGNGCTLSVFDIQEAKDICSQDVDCKAFVVTNQTTWTGRKLVHFKSDFSHKPVWNSITTLFVKDTQ